MKKDHDKISADLWKILTLDRNTGLSRARVNKRYIRGHMKPEVLEPLESP